MINGQFYGSFVKWETLTEHSVYFVHTIHIRKLGTKKKYISKHQMACENKENSLWTLALKESKLLGDLLPTLTEEEGQNKIIQHFSS